MASAGKSRRVSAENGWATILWAEDGHSFKLEQEAVGLSDDNVEDWVADVRRELKKHREGRNLVCTSLNLSRNDLEDYGVSKIIRLFTKMNVSVLLLKLYKNWIADEGMQAIGDFIFNVLEPVQEIHLSHNMIGYWGALAVFEAVKESGKYPYNRGKGGTGTPLWLRMENNQIDWEPVLKQLEDWKMKWSTGDNRDCWKMQRPGSGEADAACPMVAMHRSYHHQTQAATPSHKPTWGGGRADDDKVQSPQRQLETREQREWRPAREPRGPRESRIASKETKGAGRYANAQNAPDSVDLRETRSYIDRVFHDFTEQQNKKFELIFAVLGELKTRQTELESCVQELQQQQQQHLLRQQQMQVQHQPGAQFAAVQIVPVDGSVPQAWGGNDRHGHASVVW